MFFHVGGGGGLANTSHGQGRKGWGSGLNMRQDVLGIHEIWDGEYSANDNLICNVTTCECSA